MKNSPVLILILTLSLLFVAAAPAQQPLTVSVQRFGDIAIAKALQFPARVINLKRSNVAAEANGRITRVNFSVGDQVQQGQLLIELDCSASRLELARLQAGLKRLKANRKLTRQQLHRARTLRQSNSVSREQLDQRETQLEADTASIAEQQALLQSTQQRIDWCQIKAPFAGTVISRNAATGGYASIGSTQLTLVAPKQVELELKLPKGDLKSLQRAQLIDFEWAGQRYPVTLRSVLPVVDAASLQSIVRLRFSSADKPPGGSYGVLHFDSARNFCPAHLIQRRAGVDGVFLLQNRRARFIALTDAQPGQPARLDMPPDSLIIDSHLLSLQDQQAVVIKSPDAE